MTYEETIEIEENINLKNHANRIHNDFINNVKLSVKNFDGKRFKLWSDNYNAKYVEIINGKLVYQCRFLHETYDIAIEPAAIFDALKSKYRGVDHLKADSKLLNF